MKSRSFWFGLAIFAALVLATVSGCTNASADGDIRRLVVGKKPIERLTAGEAMTPNPKRVTPASAAYDALNLMEKHQITVLPVTDAAGTVTGILHLHEILGKGAFRFNGS